MRCILQETYVSRRGRYASRIIDPSLRFPLSPQLDAAGMAAAESARRVSALEAELAEAKKQAKSLQEKARHERPLSAQQLMQNACCARHCGAHGSAAML